MRLNAVRLTNFRQHADTRIEFDLGLTAIIGVNGAGKSTIFEAIAWALYGNAAARGTRDSIRFTGAPARARVEVELDFELANHRYRVIRGLTSAELYLDGAPEPIANSITAVNEQLQRRLGMSRGEFFNTYFTGQKELNVMAAMGPSERAQFLSRVLGYERLRSAQTLVRERRRLITAEVAGLRSAMPDPDAVARQLAESEERVTHAKARVEEAEARRREREEVLGHLAPRWTRLQQERDKLQEILSELRVAEAEEAAASRDFDRLDRELAAVAAARGELEELAAALLPLGTVAEEFRRFETLARDEGRRQTLLESARVLADDLAKLRERRERVENAPQLEEEVVLALEQKRRDLEQTQDALEAARTEWVRDRQEVETKRDALRRDYQELKKQRDQIVDLGEDGTCPTCSRPLREHFRSVLEQFDEQLETILVDGRFYNTRVEQLIEMPVPVKDLDEQRRTITAEVSALERKLAKVQLAVQERSQLARELTMREQRHEVVQRDLAAVPTGYDATRHAELRRETERLAPLNERATRLSALIEREPELTADHATVSAALSALRLRIAGLRQRREVLDFSEQDFAALRGAYEQAAAEARAAEVSAAQAQGDAAGARAALEGARRAQTELARMQETLDRLGHEKKLHEELDRTYSDLRTDLNAQLRPELSEVASAFLAELTDDRYTELELDDEYNVRVLEGGVPKPVISGGEEDVANLALRLAISQMIAERVGQAFSLLVLDEVIASLDEARRQNVVELLRQLGDRFEQILLLTHVEIAAQGLSRVLNVRYDPERGCSVVEGGGSDVLELALGGDDPDADDPMLARAGGVA